MKLFLNGELIEESKAKISLLDRGFLFGDGVFTTAKVSEGIVDCLTLHLERLYEQCEALRIEPPTLSFSQIERLLIANDALRGVWRLKIIITGGDSPLLSLPKRPYGNLIMQLKSYSGPPPFYRLKVYPEPLIRPLSRLKTLSYLDRLQLKQYAIDQGVDDLIVTSPEGFILETAFSNIFWIGNGVLCYPDPSLPLLLGIGLKKMIASDIISRPERLRINELGEDMRLFACNALTGPVPIISVDDRLFNIA